VTLTKVVNAAGGDGDDDVIGDVDPEESVVGAGRLVNDGDVPDEVAEGIKLANDAGSVVCPEIRTAHAPDKTTLSRMISEMVTCRALILFIDGTVNECASGQVTRKTRFACAAIAIQLPISPRIREM